VPSFAYLVCGTIYLFDNDILASGSTVNFMLRKESVFDNDEKMQPYIKSGKARLVSGDALQQPTVQRAWDFASEVGKVDLVLFTVGGAPNFSLTRGLYLDPADICTRSMLNLLSVLPREPSAQPKLVLISSNGLTKKSHQDLPILLKPFYSTALAGPHADKIGMERAVAEAAGWEWTDEEPGVKILPEGWKQNIAKPNLEHVVIIRPVLLTDGKCVADEKDKKKKPYKVAEDDQPGYIVSRRDVAHFIVEDLLKEWSTWEGKKIGIAY